VLTLAAKYWSGLFFCLVGVSFILFRRWFARGASGYVKMNWKYEMPDTAIMVIEYFYAVLGSMAFILGAYIFVAGN